MEFLETEYVGRVLLYDFKLQLRAKPAGIETALRIYIVEHYARLTGVFDGCGHRGCLERAARVRKPGCDAVCVAVLCGCEQRAAEIVPCRLIAEHSVGGYVYPAVRDLYVVLSAVRRAAYDDLAVARCRTLDDLKRISVFFGKIITQLACRVGLSGARVRGEDYPVSVKVLAAAFYFVHCIAPFA